MFGSCFRVLAVIPVSDFGLGKNKRLIRKHHVLKDWEQNEILIERFG